MQLFPGNSILNILIIKDYESWIDLLHNGLGLKMRILSKAREYCPIYVGNGEIDSWSRIENANSIETFRLVCESIVTSLIW